MKKKNLKAKMLKLFTLKNDKKMGPLLVSELLSSTNSAFIKAAKRKNSEVVVVQKGLKPQKTYFNELLEKQLVLEGDVLTVSMGQQELLSL